MSSQKLLSQLALVCSSCDHYNPPGTQTCICCGSQLDAPVGAGQKNPAPPIPSRQPALGDAPISTTQSYAKPSIAQQPPRTTTNPMSGPPAMAQRPPAAAAPPPAAQRPAAPPPQQPQQQQAAGGPPNLRARPPAAATPPLPITTQGRPQPAAVARPAEPIPATDLLKKPKAPAPAPASSTNAARFALAVIAGPATGQRFRLAGAGFVLGRSRGAILFPDDPFISAHHATFSVRDGRLYVRDENSASGVYVTIHSQELVAPQTQFVAANRCFRFTGGIQPTAPVPGRPIIYGAPVPTAQALFGIEEVLVGGRPGRAVVTAAPLLTIGSGKCDMTFANEEGLAQRHCELSPQLPQAMLRDLSGGLGTYVRLQPAVDRPLTPGDRLRVGEQIIEVEAIA